ncbi:hypothetical protein [Spirosoma flavum]|uniref:Uncharacterized protein n=1 Tax=Spirosoma flavum TaxID=2048557 RepID=A0ABW6AQW6_9BACT
MENRQLKRSKQAKVALLSSSLAMGIVLGTSLYSIAQSSGGGDTKYPIRVECYNADGCQTGVGTVCGYGGSGCFGNGC